MTRAELAGLIDRELAYVTAATRARRPVDRDRIRNRILDAAAYYAGQQYVSGVADVALRGRATVPDPGEET